MPRTPAHLCPLRGIAAAIALWSLLSALSATADTPPGLQVSVAGTLLRHGKPYRGIGVNYFDAFARVLSNPADTSYRAGFHALRERHIPFVRFMAGGFWPTDNRLYFDDREAYFRRLDAVVQCAEQEGVGLIPSLFWNLNTVPDLVGEPMQAWGDPQSKTIAFVRRYTREIVSRYRRSPAIWGWEFGNEYNLAADLPNASEHRPPIVPDLGTPKTRSERDEISHDVFRTALREFGKAVRAVDRTRPIFSGNGFPRPSAWHQRAERSWKQDTEAQYAEMLIGDAPAPLDTLCVHLYPDDERRFDRSITALELLRASMEAARRSHRPLFVGEFGASDEKGAEAGRSAFQGLLDAVVVSGAPLAAMWVYDYAGQDRVWNVTAANNRAYQLDLIEKANRTLGGQP